MNKWIDLRLVSTICLMGLLFSVVVLSYKGLSQYSDGTEERQTAKIEEIIRKAAVQCYALEGQYPPDIYYLAENYGIILREDQYIYHYESFGSGIAPNVMVFAKFER